MASSNTYDAWKLRSNAEGWGKAHSSTPEEQEADAAAKRQEQEDAPSCRCARCPICREPLCKNGDDVRITGVRVDGQPGCLNGGGLHLQDCKGEYLEGDHYCRHGKHRAKPCEACEADGRFEED